MTPLVGWCIQRARTPSHPADPTPFVKNDSHWVEQRNAGTLHFTSVASLGSGGVYLNNGGNLKWGAANLDISTQPITFGTGTVTLNTNNNSFSLANSIGGGGSANLIRTGGGNVTLGAPAGWTGTTSLSGGTTILSSPDQISSNTLILASSVISTSATMTLPNAVTLSANTSMAGTGNLTFSGELTNTAGNRTITNNQTGATGLTFSGNINLSESAGTGRTLTLAGGATSKTTISGVIRDAASGGMAGGLTINPTAGGLVTLTGNNTYTGVTTISSGILQIGNGGGTGTLGAGSVVNDSILRINRNNNFALNNAVSGSGSLQQNGSGTTSISGANTYSGTTTINSGVLSVDLLADGGLDSSIGRAGNAAASLLLGNGSTLRYTGNAATTDRSFTINGTSAGHGATLDASGAGPIAFTSSASPAYGTTNQSRTLTLTGTNTGDNFLAANLGNNSAGAVSVNKSGPGKWILSGASSYTGATSVNGGTLQVSSSGSINSTSGITITAGTFHYEGSAGLTRNVTLSGTGNFRYNNSNVYSGSLTVSGGTISGTGNLSNTALNIASGVSLSPGNSPGSLQTGDQTWAGGGTYVWEINRATGAQGSDPGWDFAEINDQLLITATPSNQFTILITGLNLSNAPGLVTNFDNSQNYSWTIATASHATAPITGFDAAAFTLDTSNFINNNSLGGGSFEIVQSGGDIHLHFVAVPEPSSAGVISLGLATLTVLLRRLGQRHLA